MFSRHRQISKNIETVLSILDDEVRGDVTSALKKLAPTYSMTWVYRDRKTGRIFPRQSYSSLDELAADLWPIYQTRDRHYEVKHIVAGNDVVIIELIESYPSDYENEQFRTPLVLVLEFSNGKIVRGRHYCDPAISELKLSASKIHAVFQ
jgi:ketosteroid isomerase-like protein